VGAGAFGFPAFWLNRSEATPEELGIAPEATVKGLRELTDLF
jgi:hypothetical protein